MPADPQRDGHRIAAIASILVPMLILTGGLVLSDHVSFNRWDNAEAYVAQLWHTHQRILDADLPYWNQHQDMGRPVLARSTHGVFYPGYTISVWVADVAGLGQTGNLAVITLLHAGFAGLAVFCFAHELGARPVFALMASIGVVLSGNIQYVGSVWVFVLPYMGWSVWSLWGLRRLIDMDRPAAGFVGASLSLAVLFHMGHVEWAFKCWLMSAFFAIGYGLVRKNLHRRVGYLVALAVAAALLAMPTLLPVMELAEQSRRNKPFSAEVFSAGGVSPESLIGLLLPVLGGNDGFFVRETVLCSLYFGAWVLPAILLWMFYRRTPSKSVGPAIALLTAMGIVIIWLSTGEDGLLHPLTRWIPVWSRFRWPFKIYERAIPLLVIAGALSIELMAARKFSAFLS